MSAVNRVVRSDMRVSLLAGTIDKARAAAAAGATEAEVEAIFRAGLVTKVGEPREEMIVRSPVQLMVPHPLGGAM